MPRKALLAAIVVTCIAHLLTLSVDAVFLHWVLKLAPLVLIWLFAASGSADKSPYRSLLLTGLLFCMTGDAFLLLSGSTWFLLGLLAFLTGHILYIAAFLTRRKRTNRSLLALVPIVLYGIFMAAELHRGMFKDSDSNSMWMPVLAYLIVISVMLLTAVMTGRLGAALGAVCFVVSDSLLAWNKFIGSFTGAGFLIMLTYFAAQLLIAASVSEDKSPGEHSINSAAL
ncbi:lysoplasmalogenase [Paenibacillus sp. MBLB4367]|uniref:lysoplasmalogenase n=1 Tax=Paenibacillus sp. MBLB4367 TaxID=3384767 RepID=UPI0039081E58